LEVNAQKGVVFVGEFGVGRPIPFAAIKGISHRFDTIADATGHCSLPYGTYQVSHPNYTKLQVVVSNKKDTTKASLYLRSLYETSKITPDALQRFMEQVLLNKQYHDPLTRGNFEYLTYTRYSISPDSVNKIAKFFNIGLRIVNLPLLALTTYDHHLLMAEITTRYNYRNFLNQRETITSSQVTGIDRDDVVAPIFLQNSTSPYEDRIVINGAGFMNPVSPSGLQGYRFRASDTITHKGDKWIAVKFYPARRGFNILIKGLMWINTRNAAIMAYYAETAERLDGRIGIAFLNHEQNDIVELKQKLMQDYIDFNLNPTHIYSLTTYKPAPYVPQKFDEVIFKYDSSKVGMASHQAELYHRFSYSRKDSMTLKYFKDQGDMLQVNKYVNLFERLYYAQLPIGSYLNLQLNKLFALSTFEGLRVGAGIITSDDFSRRLVLNSYIGYGVFDSRFKYGLGGTYNVLDNDRLKIKIERISDVKEPATQNFVFDKRMYSAESLRRLQLPDVDYFLKNQIGIESQLFRNFYLAAGLRFWNFNPNYSYTFKPDGKSPVSENIKVSERYLGLRWSYGEQFAKIDQLKVSIGTLYPEVWLQLSSGLFGRKELDALSFTKIDAKVNFKYYHPNGGISGLQLIGGIANGEIPYQNLYNIKGSYRTFSLVTFNSFETMRFQEFLADRFAASFATHQFPAWYFPKLPFHPRLTVVHNMGYGQLASAANHQNIKFKVFNKPYLETGVFFSDVLILEVGGGTLGIGAGIFARYGYYALPNMNDNLAKKVTLNFSF